MFRRLLGLLIILNALIVPVVLFLMFVVAGDLVNAVQREQRNLTATFNQAEAMYRRDLSVATNARKNIEWHLATAEREVDLAKQRIQRAGNDLSRAFSIPPLGLPPIKIFGQVIELPTVPVDFITVPLKKPLVDLNSEIRKAMEMPLRPINNARTEIDKIIAIGDHFDDYERLLDRGIQQVLTGLHNLSTNMALLGILVLFLIVTRLPSILIHYLMQLKTGWDMLLGR